MPVVQPIAFCAELEANWNVNNAASVLQDQVQKVQRGALPIIVAPEFLFAGRNAGMIAPLAPAHPKLNMIGRFQALSAGALVIPGTRVQQNGAGLSNSTEAWYNGQPQIEVFKLQHGGHAEPLQWVKPARVPAPPPQIHPDTFTVTFGDSTIRIGIEICTDKSLMKAFLGNPNTPRQHWPALYVQTSYGMSLSNYIAWNNEAKAFQFKRLVGGNRVWATQKYTIDIATDPTVAELVDFALHPLQPGMFIQTDGHFCRVGYKYPNSADRFTLVPPLESVRLEGSTANEVSCSASIHRFPAVDLNPLGAYWV